jgi:Na+/proline symporter
MQNFMTPPHDLKREESKTAKEVTLPVPTPQTDLALRRYDVLFRYLAYENTVYWTRSQFFLVANACMFAFAASKLPTSFQNLSWEHLGILATASAAGILLSMFWHRALTVGEHWVCRWEKLCVRLESEAFGEIDVLRNSGMDSLPLDSIKRVSGKAAARHSAILFIVLWCV